MSGTGIVDKGAVVPEKEGAVTPLTDSSAVADADAAEDGVPLAPSTSAAEGAGEGSVGSAPAPVGAEAEPAPDAWKAKKYDKIFAQLKSTQAELAAARAEPGAAGAGLTQADVDRQAAAIATRTEFNRRCNEVATGAKAAYPDFPARIGNLQQLVTPGDAEEAAAYGKLIEACLEVGPEAGRIIYELGGNLDEANRIMNLSPVKQGIALAALAAKKSEPEPSGTPKPLVPVGQRGATGELIDPADAARADKLSSKEWFARRQADIDKKRAAGQRIW